MENDVAMRLFAALTFIMLTMGGAAAQTALLDESDTDGQGRAYSSLYDEITDAMLTGGAVQQMGDRLWVPWYSTSSSCQEGDLQKGNACDADVIDETHNCMVTDEFSQVGVIVSMADEPDAMRSYVNTLRAIESTNGQLPSWRVYRDGDTIRVCDDRFNGNCDTASDADARAIISLWTASKNPSIPQAEQDEYAQYAAALAEDFVEYDIVDHSFQTSQGEVRYWLAAGADAARGGFGSTDFTYTGYYPDAIIAMLQSCKQTGDRLYCDVAEDIAKNYLVAANFDGRTFSAPPGRSFRFNTASGTPVAECTHSCSPVVWDGHDAPRALGLCEAQYYAEASGEDLGLRPYCELWEDQHLGDASSAAIQYYPDGTPMPAQSGHFAQGLQSLARTFGGTQTFRPTMDNALDHYSSTTRTWDWTACHGVYTQAMPTRALGVGLGRTLPTVTDAASWTPEDPITEPEPTDPPEEPEDPEDPAEPDEPTCEDPAEGSEGVGSLAFTCTAAGTSCTVVTDTTSGDCRTVLATTPHGDVQIMGCEKAQGIEVYRQAYPKDTSFRACLGDGCVDRNAGWALASYPAVMVHTMDTCTDQNQDVSEDIEEPTQEEPSAPDGSSSLDPEDEQSTIGQLPASCESDSGCSLIEDTDDGSCRRLRYAANGGEATVLACVKSPDRVELYKQSSPSGYWEVCLNDGCLGSRTGGFTTTTLTTSTVIQEPVPDLSDDDIVEEPDPIPVITDPVEEPTALSALPVACDADSACDPIQDVTDGSCRTVRYGIDGNEARILACIKGTDRVELYKQASPPGYWEICLNDGCLGSRTGGFTTTTLDGAVTQEPVSVDEEDVEAELQAPQTTTSRVAGEPVDCRASTGCTLLSDETSGTCRTVIHRANNADLKVLACEKGDAIEVYRQTAPDGYYEVCIGSGCVDEDRGFDRYTPS